MDAVTGIGVIWPDMADDQDLLHLIKPFRTQIQNDIALFYNLLKDVCGHFIPMWRDDIGRKCLGKKWLQSVMTCHVSPAFVFFDQILVDSFHLGHLPLPTVSFFDNLTVPLPKLFPLALI